MCVCVYVCIYIYIERERDMYIYIYIILHTRLRQPRGVDGRAPRRPVLPQDLPGLISSYCLNIVSFDFSCYCLKSNKSVGP